jgi:hypothetical protein
MESIFDVMKITSAGQLNRLRLSAAGLLAILIGAQMVAAAPIDEVTARGFKHSNLDRAFVAKSVERANTLLHGTGIRFAPSWLPRDKSSLEGISSIPLFLVATFKEASSTPAAVPEGCICVFVNPAYLASWIEFNSSGTGRMALDRGYFLTMVLLHEAGHIKEGSPAAAFKNGELSQLNIDPSVAKVNEQRADEFAAQLLRRHAYTKPATATSLEANLVVNELTKLSWNMQAFRTLDEFGAFAVGKRSVYLDDGYSHPNMALRVLRINHLIQASDATRSLLEAFESARQRGANPEPLYRRR